MDIRSIIAIGLAVCAVIGTIAMFAILWRNRYDPVLTGFIMRHFAAIVGLPAAAAAAFIIVAIFRQGEGPLEFSGLGFHFKGAAGEVVLWVLCFLIVTISIRLLWMGNSSLPPREHPAATPTRPKTRSPVKKRSVRKRAR
jgi:hypothetical protein